MLLIYISFANLFLSYYYNRNLMKRAENCVDCKITHVRFEDDCLVFEFAKSKGHQDGEEHVGPWHVYANPLEPHLCPVLAMARYLFMYPSVLVGKSALFEGKDQYSRYAKIFARVVIEHMDELKLMGVREGELGTHSSRKGVATMVAAGSTASPPIISICLRAGWVMGGVKDKYLKYERAGDQYVGRCACCLNQNNKEFAITPPYFDFTSIDNIIDQNERKRKVEKWLKDRLINVERIEGNVMNLAMQCFASICYHHTFLDKNLHPNNPFRNAAIFKDIPKDVRDCSRTAYPWSSTADTPQITGVPPHILIMSELEEVKRMLSDLKVTMRTDLRSELNDRGVGGAEFHTNRILDSIQELSGRFEALRTAPPSALQQENELDLYVFDDEEDTDTFIERDGQTAGERHQRNAAMQERGETAVKKRRFTVGLVKDTLTLSPQISNSLL